MSERNAILQITNAGFGETPPCPEAKFKAGDTVKVRRLKHLRDYPEIAVVAIVVPPGFPAEYAFADATGRPRPLMITKPCRCVSYIVGFEGDERPHLLMESTLKPSGLPPSEVKWMEAQNTEQRP